MPWYYVGPDAKPVGPLSLEELQSRRANGALSPETYIIEAPIGGTPKDWRRYREIFPNSAAFPLLPALPPVPTSLPPPISPHPLFPSAVPASAAPSPGGPVFTGVHPSTYNPPYHPPSKTNAWCAWGFGLSLAGLLCAFLAPFGLVASVVGLVQVHKHRDQQGRGLAITGLLVSVMLLALVVAIGAALAFSSLRTSVQMTTEQTSNDSDTR